MSNQKTTKMPKTSIGVCFLFLKKIRGKITLSAKTVLNSCPEIKEQGQIRLCEEESTFFG